MVHESPGVEHNGKKMQHLGSLLFMNFHVSISQLPNSTRQLSHTELFSMIKVKKTQIKQVFIDVLMPFACIFSVHVSFWTLQEQTIPLIRKPKYSFSALFYLTPRKQCW